MFMFPVSVYHLGEPASSSSDRPLKPDCTTVWINETKWAKLANVPRRVSQTSPSSKCTCSQHAPGEPGFPGWSEEQGAPQLRCQQHRRHKALK